MVVLACLPAVEVLEDLEGWKARKFDAKQLVALASELVRV